MASRINLNCNDSNKPSWLLSSISDLEERMKTLALVNPSNEESNGDTFAERAESYYSKKPQLLALLQDLYNAYLTLSDRFVQLSSSTSSSYSLKRHHSQATMATNDTNEGNDNDDEEESDLESSLSYQPQPQAVAATAEDYDAVVAELVARSVEAEVLAEEARRCGEWRRKAELQGSLVEVLESEREVLLRENARASRRCAVLTEDAEAMAAEAAYMRRKAGELARCLVMRVREEQRVCALSRKIEDLQGQIYGLEKRKGEYYKQLQQQANEHESTSTSCSSSSSSNSSCSSFGGSAKRTKKKNNKKRNEVVFEGCFRKLKVNKSDQKVVKKKRDEKGVLGWWDRVKGMDLFLCGVASNSA